MPAFTMPGMASGQDTNTMVKQLVELEKKPIKRWEMENVYSNAQIETWNELKKRTADLQSKTRNLTTFTSALATKKIVPSEEGVISGEATRGAKAGKKSIEILELASNHQISGTNSDLNKEIPAGKYSIVSGKEKIDLEFPGGKLTDLSDQIKSSASGIASAHLVRVTSEEGIISLTANKAGKKNQLKFMDPDGVLFSAGLVGEYTPPPEPIVNSIALSVETVEEYNSEKYEKNKLPESKPTKLESGIQFVGLTAFSFPVSGVKAKDRDSLKFTVEGEEKPPRLDVGLYFKESGKEEERYRNASLYPSEDGGYEWELSDSLINTDITKIVIMNSADSNLTIGKLEILSQPEWVGAEPANTISEAKDAVFKIDGIEIKRESNDNINDVLESISFNLHKTTEEPITFEIEPETDKGKELIVDFVNAYNELMKFTKEATFMEIGRAHV